MQYKYEAVSPAGESVRGTIEAESEAIAEERLWESNLTVVRLKVHRPPMTLDEAVPTLFGVKREDVINLSRQLASLLDAGVSILPALELLQDQVTKASVRKVVIAIIGDLQSGSLFSASCARHPDIFPPVFLKLAAIAEETGNLPVMLRHIANYMEKESALAKKIQKSLAYPLTVLVVALVAVFILINFVLPSLAGLFKEVGSELPLISRILLNVAAFISAYFAYLLGGALVIGLAAYMYLRTPQGVHNKDRFFLSAPIVRTLVVNSNMARLTRTMALLMQAGIPVMDVLNLAVGTPLNQVLRDALVAVCDNIRAGQSISQAFAAQKAFPKMASQLIAVGEQTGRLGTNLETLAAFYESEADQAMASAIGFIEPALILVVGGIVAFIAISVISPIYSAIQTVR
ncbi:MAG: type II secretion system F family protein [Dehalococcoidia bacterium]|nr:type II secretion system F family protein [Dehalococcoidia bacterium]